MIDPPSRKEVWARRLSNTMAVTYLVWSFGVTSIGLGFFSGRPWLGLLSFVFGALSFGLGLRFDKVARRRYEARVQRMLQIEMSSKTLDRLLDWESE